MVARVEVLSKLCVEEKLLPGLQKYTSQLHALITSAGLRSSPLPLPDVPMCRTTVSVSVWGLRSWLEVVPGTLQISFACVHQW